MLLFQKERIKRKVWTKGRLKSSRAKVKSCSLKSGIWVTLRLDVCTRASECCTPVPWLVPVHLAGLLCWLHLVPSASCWFLASLLPWVSTAALCITPSGAACRDSDVYFARPCCTFPGLLCNWNAAPRPHNSCILCAGTRGSSHSGQEVKERG